MVTHHERYEHRLGDLVDDLRRLADEVEATGRVAPGMPWPGGYPPHATAAGQVVTAVTSRIGTLRLEVVLESAVMADLEEQRAVGQNDGPSPAAAPSGYEVYRRSRRDRAPANQQPGPAPRSLDPDINR
jgi:hypothetical protein